MHLRRDLGDPSRRIGAGRPSVEGAHQLDESAHLLAQRQVAALALEVRVCGKPDPRQQHEQPQCDRCDRGILIVEHDDAAEDEGHAQHRSAERDPTDDPAQPEPVLLAGHAPRLS